MGDSDEEDYHFFGTPIEDDHEVRAGTYRKEPGKDAATTRQLPVWNQEVTDAQGRRRFHGAFTGGFSAGYYNTVGSAEGWAPSSFRSSRSDARGAPSAAGAAPARQSVEQFLDEDELEELRQTNLQSTAAYDTFGSTAAEAARRALEEEARQRPSAIPGLLPEEAIAPVAEGIGIKLLQRMGWRQGKGVGAAGTARQDGNSRRGWGQVAGIGPENTPLHLIKPKHDVHGIGYDPFKGAEEFRAAAAAQHGLPTTNTNTAMDQRNKRRRGVAFGSGVLDEDDTFGMMEDYVTHDDIESYEEIAGLDTEGLPQRRGLKVEHQGLGDRLALQGFAYEVQDDFNSEEDDEDDIPGGSLHKKQRILQLTGSTAPLLLKNATELHEQRQQGLISGFVLAINEGLHKPAYYPPPSIPADYIPVHRPVGKTSLEDRTAGGAAAVGAPVPPPENEVLRQEIERLAFFVARNGPSFEVLAREQQQRALTSGASTPAGQNSFLLGGHGAEYYAYKLASLRALLAPRGKYSKPLLAPIGQRSTPLTAEDRGAMLGEQPLPSSISTAPAAAAAGGGRGRGGEGVLPVTAGAMAPPPVPLARSILNLAEEDRKRLAAAMGSTFVRGETEGDRPLTDHGGSGLRPGVAAAVPAQTGTIPFESPSTASTAPISQKPCGIVTWEDLSRPLGAVSTALHQQESQQHPPTLPVRKSEEWRPEPLLCKRLDVPDPYRGKPKETQMSRFKTDYVALPATVEALGRAAAAAAPSGPEFLLPPAVRVAAEEAAAAAAQLAARTERVPLPPPAFPPSQEEQLQQDEEADDIAGAAEAFLSSLFGQSADAEVHDKAEEQVLREVGALEKPVDLFKAIFEDSEEEEEEDKEEDEDQDGETQDVIEGQEKTSLPQQQQHENFPGRSIHDRNTEFGFEKFRGGGAAAAGNLEKIATTGAAMAATGEPSLRMDMKGGVNPSGVESLDPEMRSRVEAALKVLHESKKKHKERKKKKRKKEHKDRDASLKRKGRDKEKKKRKKRRKERSNDSSDASSSGSDTE